ncbi:hypothetical protein BMETH_321_3 [methanotrophic bacterial endosymbiont of Bathymodiolus sp.]|nr:hypothetical protein BMETH_321_3 [methanotrophic bacterial endosymbiont of Bathymodiolus sp.]
MGVFLLPSTTVAVFLSLPHARGGVSLAFKEFTVVSESSPRPWGCF